MNAAARNYGRTSAKLGGGFSLLLLSGKTPCRVRLRSAGRNTVLRLSRGRRQPYRHRGPMALVLLGWESSHESVENIYDKKSLPKLLLPSPFVLDASLDPFKSAVKLAVQSSTFFFFHHLLQSVLL